MSRRGFLGLGAGAAVATGVLWNLPSGDERAMAAVRPRVGEPEILESRRGRLSVTLVAEERPMMVAGRIVNALVFNGSLPGPTLVVEPGDRLDIRLINRLSQPTNLHTHGLHVSPEGNSDNVLVHVGPGETFDYRIQLPDDHPVGLNWYHPHPHGGQRQLHGGMAGAIIVRARSERAPAVARMRERVMVLQTPEWDSQGNLKPITANSIYTQLKLVNGEQNPRIEIPFGTTERWRFVNSSAGFFFDLKLDGHTMLQVGADSHFFRTPDRRDSVTLAPGQRADVLVTPRERGTFALRAMPFNEGLGFVTPETVLATVSSAGRWRDQRVAVAPLLRPFRDLRRLPVDRRRNVTFSIRKGFVIDGKPFDPRRADQTVRLGDVEEWTVVNDSPLVHPFHIHVNPFQLTHVNGEPVEVKSYIDTHKVDVNGGSITFRTRFEDFPGRAVYHCHIATHSDLGMMAIAEVLRPGEQPGHYLGDGPGLGHGH
jgi:FtsP/CotA-like multicopper oxidase with cupredoxin domain